MAIADEITRVIRDRIAHFDGSTTDTAMVSVGTVIEVADGIARVYGLSGVGYLELVEFPRTGLMGVAFNLEEDSVAVPVLGDFTLLHEDDEVRTTGRIIQVPVGDALLGRTVNALGEPIDGGGPIATDKFRPVERVAPGVITRHPVDTPVQTGLKVVDALIPIGRGQRELIIGDRQTGKTALALDTIINQKGKDLICIYVSIGQKNFQVAQIAETLRRFGALEHTIIVHAGAEDPAPLKYLAPYAGAAMGEEIMESGRDALIVYDDLSKHADAYRNMSLIIRRPPGREAYPGDVFYLHSRLLERAARLNQDYGGGSLTALPVIETKGNDVSAYIPTNVISITDGQIFLETDLFNSGVRPAITVGISVSRVGGNAQVKAMKSVAGRLRLDLAQYRELESFAAFGSDLDKASKAQLERGARLVELLKQRQYEPYPVERQVVSVWAGTSGSLDDVPTEDIARFEREFLEYVGHQHKGIYDAIVGGAKVEGDLQEQLESAISDF